MRYDKIIARIGRRIKVSAARLGIELLHRSGVLSGYYAEWRWALFDYAERRGIHVLPTHYYTPIPDLRSVTLDSDRRRFTAADDAQLESALDLLSTFASRFGDKYDEIAGRTGQDATRFEFGRAPYNPAEAEALYGMIRTRRPARIVEIGCGHTTFLIAEAIADEPNYAPHYCCVEPYRPDYLRTPPVEVSEFFDQPLQSVSIEFFTSLQRGDILFIDSSHVVKYGSDVIYAFLDILPNLASGVLVHVHDVFLPYDYPSEWLTEGRFFWSEQYLLDVFLKGGRQVRPTLPLHQIFRERRAELQALFPMLADPAMRPSAYWFEIGSP